MTVEELISKKYDELSQNDRLIARYILNNKELIPLMSIDELAAHCHVSRSTVMRFAQKLELKGFAELKIRLKMDNSSLPDFKGNLVDIVCENDINVISHFKRMDMEEICRDLYRAKRIFVYGTGSIQRNIANEFKRIFLYLGSIVDVILGEGEFIQTSRLITDQDVVLIISKNGESEFLQTEIKKLQIKDVSLISLTCSGNNSLARASKHNIFVNIERHMLIDNFYFDTMFLMYYAVEILFAKYVEFSREQQQKEQ